jgi:hypothetical protein
MIGLALGFAVNLGDVDAARAGLRGRRHDGGFAALPAALFGLGGVLTRYALRASLGEAGMIAALSLLVHPAIASASPAHVFALPPEFVRSAVVTASMAPGVNAYVFASLYSRGQAQAASVVLLATAISCFTISAWLALRSRAAVSCFLTKNVAQEASRMRAGSVQDSGAAGKAAARELTGQNAWQSSRAARITRVEPARESGPCWVPSSPRAATLSLPARRPARGLSASSMT